MVCPLVLCGLTQLPAAWVWVEAGTRGGLTPALWPRWGCRRVGACLVLIVILLLSPSFLRYRIRQSNGSCKDMMCGLGDPYTVIAASAYSECQVHSRSKEAESKRPPLIENRKVILSRVGNTTGWSPWGSGKIPCPGVLIS